MMILRFRSSQIALMDLATTTRLSKSLGPISRKMHSLENDSMSGMDSSIPWKPILAMASIFLVNVCSDLQPMEHVAYEMGVFSRDEGLIMVDERSCNKLMK